MSNRLWTQPLGSELACTTWWERALPAPPPPPINPRPQNLCSPWGLLWYSAVYLHGHLSSLAVQCHLEQKTRGVLSSRTESSKSALLNMAISASEPAVSPLEPNPWSPSIWKCLSYYLIVLSPYLCQTSGWPMSCAAMFLIWLCLKDNCPGIMILFLNGHWNMIMHSEMTKSYLVWPFFLM